MGLFDGIEKLITEHGSAAILKERIALVKDQYSALEKQLLDSQLRVKELESENQCLEFNNSKLKEKIRGLESQLSEAHDKTASLEEIREKILILVSQHEKITDAQVARAVGVGEQLATFHLNELEKADFVLSSFIMGDDWTGERSRNEWYITQNGRSYLVRRGLLQ
jgi:predicted nuclease with TOPRIM domain